MRDMNDEYRLAVRIPWTADDLLRDLESRLKRDRSLWQAFPGGRKKPTKAGVVAAIMLLIDAMSQEEQDAFMARAMPLLNAYIEDRPPETSKKPLTEVDLDPPSPGKKRSRR